ncbi:hypothetical protein E2562_008896 [Oryza meyeriana var. granulata]|uniref:Uncharacterized protein n=1 Tax=Oryza meyeriana var. granulata TaxID=110450 RepID=A0A6G1D0E8_9ORYZ|nr:hypothetical protein E2562_008896 [Oryza meyeriana var. granulata]
MTEAVEPTCCGSCLLRPTIYMVAEAGAGADALSRRGGRRVKWWPRGCRWGRVWGRAGGGGAPSASHRCYSSLPVATISPSAIGPGSTLASSVVMHNMAHCRCPDDLIKQRSDEVMVVRRRAGSGRWTT